MPQAFLIVIQVFEATIFIAAVPNERIVIHMRTILISAGLFCDFILFSTKRHHNNNNGKKTRRAQVETEVHVFSSIQICVCSFFSLKNRKEILILILLADSEIYFNSVSVNFFLFLLDLQSANSAIMISFCFHTLYRMMFTLTDGITLIQFVYFITSASDSNSS